MSSKVVIVGLPYSGERYHYATLICRTAITLRRAQDAAAGCPAAAPSR
jgi:hypothetical protein